MIDWQRVCLDLRQTGTPLSKVAQAVGSSERHLNRLARDEVQQPRFDVGMRLLDLHYDKCPEAHRAEVIGQW